jgi:acyl CoA:acetate/3-ketoacid CoA transferase alpha subunit
MALKKVISADDAVALVRDGDIVASSGYGGNGIPKRCLPPSNDDFWLGTGRAA